MGDLYERFLQLKEELEYMGMFCRRDRGRAEPFLNEERKQAVQDFAQAICMAIRAEGR